MTKINMTMEIRKAMLNAGYDQKSLAKKLSIPESTVSYWVRHPESLKLSQWQLINRILHIPGDVIVTAGGFAK